MCIRDRDPSVPLTPDAWVARFAELPLMHQPGADWMYELSFAVLGVVLARAGGQPLDDLLRDRLLTPLGMADTGFEVPAGARLRLVPCYTPGENGLEVFDSAEASRWLLADLSVHRGMHATAVRAQTREQAQPVLGGAAGGCGQHQQLHARFVR